MKKYNVGDIIKVKVTAIKNYGAFVIVDKDYSGLIHISEISNSFVKDIRDYVNVNKVINAKILAVDDDKKQITLSIKDLQNNLNYPQGFNGLQNNLNIWINEKLSEIHKNT